MADENDNTDNKIGSASDAAGRFFRAYEKYCCFQDSDSLFNFFNSMHSLNDRLKQAADGNLLDIEEYVALKALRNFAHHQDEVRSRFKIIPNSAISDLAVVCIVRRDQVELTIKEVKGGRSGKTREACEAHFHWYGEAVNINPCIFNLVVRVYETLRELGVKPPEEAVSTFRDSYEFEEQQGHSHYVDGRIATSPAKICAVLSSIVANLPSP